MEKVFFFKINNFDVKWSLIFVIILFDTPHDVNKRRTCDEAIYLAT